MSFSQIQQMELQEVKSIQVIIFAFKSITIFLVVMMSNWVGIMPGVGSVGRIEDLDEWVHHHYHKYEDELSDKYVNL